MCITDRQSDINLGIHTQHNTWLNLVHRIRRIAIIRMTRTGQVAPKQTSTALNKQRSTIEVPTKLEVAQYRDNISTFISRTSTEVMHQTRRKTSRYNVRDIVSHSEIKAQALIVSIRFREVCSGKITVQSILPQFPNAFSSIILCPERCSSTQEQY